MFRYNRKSLYSKLDLCVMLAVVVSPILVNSLAIARDGEAQRRHRVSGELKSHTVACATLCTAGTLTGKLAGTFEFTMLKMVPTKDPSIITYYGWQVFHTEDGDVSGPDTGSWNLSTNKFTDKFQITAGTGAWEGVSGEIVTKGVFDSTAGVGHSNYGGLLDME